MSMSIFDGKKILITGGTGSFGNACTNRLLTMHSPAKVIIFSRDEFKQWEMAKKFEGVDKQQKLRFFLGDVRDPERLHRAFQGVDYIIHAAALKQVPTAEYNPSECIKTNVDGAQNVINAAADRGVKKLVALSTDKACNPVNLYGATKLCSDKLFVAANGFFPSDETRFSIVRYGNVVASRGSVINHFLQQRATGCLTITDPRMTRFWITLEQGVDFVLDCFSRMVGGEIFVPKLPSMNILDLAKSICPNCEATIIGIRPGEKIHEVMVSRDDARNTREFSDCYIICPDNQYLAKRFMTVGGTPVGPEFEYSSGTNTAWLGVDELSAMLETCVEE
jgi:UDP-N-acetylglucosamine 4,6-dehydratase